MGVKSYPFDRPQSIGTIIESVYRLDVSNQPSRPQRKGPIVESLYPLAVSSPMNSNLASGTPACLRISLAECMSGLSKQDSSTPSVHWYTFAFSRPGSFSARGSAPAKACATGQSPSRLRPLLLRVAKAGPCVPGASGSRVLLACL